MINKSITKKFLKTLEHLKYGSMDVTTPDGKIYSFKGSESGAHGDFNITNWRTITMFAAKGDVGLTEAYGQNYWYTDNLPNLMLVGLQNEQVLDGYLYGSIFGRLALRFAYLFTRNSFKGSKRNISAHYDLGNDFYKLWLDQSMTYSSAIYKSDKDTLNQAQTNKYNRIIDNINSSGNLIEIGCGWGGFANQAMQKGDYNIKGITLSQQQYTYAKNKLGSKANIILEDYRIQHGKFDNIVSIEMFEAVGEKYWPTYFDKIKQLLANKGKAVIQTITIADNYFKSYQQGGDMIRSFIFPGGMLPSPNKFKSAANKAGLKIDGEYSFGQDYATTLLTWLKNFDVNLPQIKSMGFDSKFINIWRFYLSACYASFIVNRTGVMQYKLTHA